MADEKISPKVLEMAVELEKAGMPAGQSTFFDRPDIVAKFIEAVGKKNAIDRRPTQTTQCCEFYKPSPFILESHMSNCR